MLVEESWTAFDEKKGFWYGCGESGLFEPFTEDRGELFRAFQQSNGRCIGFVYVDTKDGGTEKVGWVFEKRRRYDDCNETYLSHTWVTLHEEKPTVATTRHYIYL